MFMKKGANFNKAAERLEFSKRIKIQKTKDRQWKGDMIIKMYKIENYIENRTSYIAYKIGKYRQNPEMRLKCEKCRYQENPES